MKIFFHNTDGTLNHLIGQLPHPLSPREIQVCTLVAAGLNDKNIAHALSLSIHTVKRYITNARIKCRAPNRAALAVAYTLQTPPPPPPAPALLLKVA